MTMKELLDKPRESCEYIGDAVYVHFDGYGVWLVTSRANGDDSIYLNPQVFNSLTKFTQVQRTRFHANLLDLQVGDRVTYYPSEDETRAEIGLVKTLPESGYCHVVYKCDNDWANFQKYTGELTPIRFLKKGWLI